MPPFGNINSNRGPIRSLSDKRVPVRGVFYAVEENRFMDYEKKIRSLALTLPAPPAPVANYLPLVRSGPLLFLSGMLPFVEGRLAFVGKVGKEVAVDQGKEAARLALLNALSAIQSEIGSLNAVERFIRLSVYVASTSEFIQQPVVANGASDLLVEIFGDAGRHARLALGAVSLPLDAPVELELIVEVTGMAPHNNDPDPLVV